MTTRARAVCLGDRRATNHHHRQLQTAVARVLDEQERNQKKGNNLNTISKMMGTLVLVQLYTFINRKALFRPQKIQKSQFGGKNGEN